MIEDMRLLPIEKWTAEIGEGGHVVVCVAEWPIGTRYFAPIKLGPADGRPGTYDHVSVVVDTLEPAAVS